MMLNGTELAVMVCLSAGPLYGRQMVQQVAEVSERRIRLTLASVYATLQRMEEKGLIAGFWGDDSETKGGARRRYYRVTPKGKAELGRTVRLALSVKPAGT